MAAKLEEMFAVQPEMIGGSGGIFDVVIDGELVYSKFKEGGFPDEKKLLMDLAMKYEI